MGGWKKEECHLMSFSWKMNRNLDLSTDLLIERVLAAQLMVGLVEQSQGSPRIMLSLREIT